MHPIHRFEVRENAVGHQTPDHHSLFLRTLPAHRPDYLVFYGGCSILVDVKNYRPRPRLNGGLRFGIPDADWTDLAATQTATGMPVAILFWNRLAQGFGYTICLLDELDIPEVDHKGENWRCRDFAQGDISTTRLVGH